MPSISTFIVNDEMTSRAGLRLAEATCSLLRDSGIDKVSLFGAELIIEPIQGVFKSVDSAWYIAKAVGDLPKITKGAIEFSKQIDMLLGYGGYTPTEKGDGTMYKTAVSFLKLVRTTFKFISNSSASLKFLGALGVPYLASRVKFFGQIKNPFALYCAVNDLALNALELNEAVYAENKRAKKVSVIVLSSVGLLCSVCMNGFGFLDSLFGAELGKKNMQRIPPFAWNTWKLGGSLSIIAGDTIKKFA